MRDIPFVARQDEVLEILRSGRVQFRRVFKPQPQLITVGGAWLYDGEIFVGDDAMQSHLFHDVYGNGLSPYGALYGDGTADRLRVKETWAYKSITNRQVYYRADGCPWDSSDMRGAWRPSTNMPRWASRLTLEVANVCIELVDDSWVWVIDATRI